MHVVATAGHVDHGKSTLVRALTGMEPDRWAAERERGMTIDLGFAWTTLPSGAAVAFVDVPGHERFVGNMLAGVGPVPAVMFVVAADEGWMPQSAEHLAALDALRVRHGLLVVTRSDLADPGPAREGALSRIARSSLGEVECVCVSAATGAGVDLLPPALDRLLSRLAAPDPAAPVRLWVDRAFAVRGAGTVVTGTLAAGTLTIGDELVLAPGGQRVRVRGLESLNTRREVVGAVARVAANLRRVALDQVRRGTALLTPDRWLTTAVADVRADGPLPREVLVHAGSAQVTARVRPFGADVARLALRSAMPLRIGDRLLLRDPGSRRIAGATVLDVRPPPLNRRGAARRRGRELAGMTGRPDPAAEIARRGVAAAAELAAMGCAGTAGIAPVAGWVIDPAYREVLRRALRAVVTAHEAAHPLDPGLPVEAARQRLDLPDRRLVEALVSDPLTTRDGRVLRSGSWDRLPDEVAGALRRLRQDLAGRPFDAPDSSRLAALGLGAAQLRVAVRGGSLLRVADGVYLLPEAPDLAVRRIAALSQPFTTSQARQALGTTRRVAVPLLELLDRTGATVRVDASHRFVTGRHPEPAGSAASSGSAGAAGPDGSTPR